MKIALRDAQGDDTEMLNNVQEVKVSNLRSEAAIWQQRKFNSSNAAG